MSKTLIIDAIEQKQIKEDNITMEKMAAEIDISKKIEFGYSTQIRTNLGDWKNETCEVERFIKQLQKSFVGERDGTCFTAGPLEGGVRNKHSIKENHIVVFNIDGGNTADEIDKLLTKAGLAYVRHTTNGHLEKAAYIKPQDLQRFKKNKETTKKILQDYLYKVKGIKRELLSKIEMEEVNTRYSLVRFHQQIERHHVILFLSEPFVFHGSGINNKAAQRLWSRQYIALAKNLGLNVDKECSDPARAWYFPRHPEGAAYDAKFQQGQYLDLAKMKTLPKEEVKQEEQPHQKGVIPSENLMPELEKMNSEYAMVLRSGESRIAWLDNGTDVKFIKKDSFFDLFANRIVELPDRRPRSLAQIWFKWSGRATYNSVSFDPSEKCADNTYNLWKGFALEPAKGDWSLLEAHIKHNICQGNEEYFTWLMCWLAQLFQKPGDKLGTAVIIGGEKGVGKSKLAYWLSQLLGKNAYTASSSKQVTGNFNAHIEICLLLIAEEAFWAGSKQDEGALKHLITGDTMSLEAKGLDASEIKNFTRLMAISNNDWIVPATTKERRFFCLECGISEQQNSCYFADIDNQMLSGGAEAMLFDLLNYDFRKVDLRNPPKTKWLVKQIEESLTDVQAWLREVLTAGCVDYGNNAQEISETACFNEKKMSEILCSTVYDSYTQFTMATHFHKPVSNVKFGKMLLKEMPSIIKTREQKQGVRQYKYQFPSLEKMRASFQDQTGIIIENIPTDDEANVIKRILGQTNTNTNTNTDNKLAGFIT